MKVVKSLIALDLAGVIEDSWPAKRKWAKDRYGRDLGDRRISSDKLVELLSLSDQQLVDMLNHVYGEETISDRKLIAGAGRGLAVLAEHFELVLLTSRPERMRASTEEWLRQNGCWDLVGPIVFLGDKRFLSEADKEREPKLSWCARNGAVALVDDSLKHLNPTNWLIGQEGIARVFFEDTRESDHDVPNNVTRVRSWVELTRFLRPLGRTQA